MNCHALHIRAAHKRNVAVEPLPAIPRYQIAPAPGDT
jgi:hypothetical protein